MQLIIRPCDEGDIELLEAELPSGRANLHRERFVEQLRGASTYLISWIDQRPVAHVQIRWSGSLHSHVQSALQQTPELGRFEVEADMRGQGIGGRLLAQAEQLVAERGYEQVGLAVGIKNHTAQRLYERAGYIDWDQGTFPSHWLCLEADGEVHSKSHVVTYLTKTLSTASAAATACA